MNIVVQMAFNAPTHTHFYGYFVKKDPNEVGNWQNISSLPIERDSNILCCPLTLISHLLGMNIHCGGSRKSKG